MKTEKEKMLTGELYDPLDPELAIDRQRCRDLCKQLNDSREEEGDERQRILNELLGYPNDAWIQPPFFCDYGYNIKLGSKVFFNFNCVVLDVMPVEIGSNVLFGPAVQIYTATHPISAAERRTWREFAKPVSIGSDVWWKHYLSRCHHRRSIRDWRGKRRDSIHPCRRGCRRQSLPSHPISDRSSMSVVEALSNRAEQ